MSLLSEDHVPFRLLPMQGMSDQDESDLFTFHGSVGPNGENRREDVIKAQTLLANSGDFKSPFDVPTGWPNRDLYSSIRAFQKRHGKQADGILLPIPSGGVDQNGVGESLEALRGELSNRLAGQTAPTPQQVDAYYQNKARFRPAVAGEEAPVSSPFGFVTSDLPDAEPPVWRDGAQVAQNLSQAGSAPVPQTKPKSRNEQRAEQAYDGVPHGSTAQSLSDKGVELLKTFERFEGRRYPDQAGHPTIGYGHRIYPHEEKRFGETIDKAAAGKLLAEDAATAQRAVRQSVKVELNQAQFDALTSFAYNIGPNGFAKSGVVKKLNDGDFRGAADELLSYNKITVQGQKVPSRGLTARRETERRIFLNGYDE